MEEDGKKGGIGYRLLYGIVYLHALLPFWMLYILSDILYLFAYHVVRYRRKLLRKNLKNAFPRKNGQGEGGGRTKVLSPPVRLLRGDDKNASNK
jgi:KDO2-lipid IV(A) lauroyltransferase